MKSIGLLFSILLVSLIKTNEATDKTITLGVRTLCELLTKNKDFENEDECINVIQSRLSPTKQNELLNKKDFYELPRVLKGNQVIVDTVCANLQPASTLNCKTTFHLLILIEAVDLSTLIWSSIQYKSYEDVLHAITYNHNLASEICHDHNESAEICIPEVQRLALKYNIHRSSLHKIVVKDSKVIDLTMLVKMTYKSMWDWAKKIQISSEAFIIEMVNFIVSGVIETETILQMKNISCWHSFLDDFKGSVQEAESKCTLDSNKNDCIRQSIVSTLQSKSYITTV